jgi:hypothetical protein
MKKSLRVAVLSTLLAVCAAPVFADPGGTDPPPPSQGTNGTHTATQILLAILGSIAG